MTRSLHTILAVLVSEAVEIGLDLPLSTEDQRRLVVVMAAIGEHLGVRAEMAEEDEWITR